MCVHAVIRGACSWCIDQWTVYSLYIDWIGPGQQPTINIDKDYPRRQVSHIQRVTESHADTLQPFALSHPHNAARLRVITLQPTDVFLELLVLNIPTRTSWFYDFTYILKFSLFSHVVFLLHSFYVCCILLCCLVRNKLIDWLTEYDAALTLKWIKQFEVERARAPVPRYGALGPTSNCLIHFRVAQTLTFDFMCIQ